MNEFMLWFWRPFAEMLAGLVIFAIFCVLYLAYFLWATWRARRKNGKAKP